MKPLRIPVAADLTDRELAFGGTYNTDTMMVNCYAETDRQTGEKFVVKRPGSLTAFTYNGGGATNAQGSVYFQNGIYTAGSNVLYRLNGAANGSADGTAWTSSTAAPWTARRYFACIVFKDQVFILGGENTAGLAFLNDVWASTDGINWTQVVSAAPWGKRSNPQVVILNDTLYLIGGQGNGVSYNDVWKSTDGVNWVSVSTDASWTARFGHQCVVFNQGIFLMGGQDATGYLNDVWFSPDGKTWTQQVTTATWSARIWFSALVYQNKIYVLGGYNGAALQSCYSTSDGINWTNTGNLPGIRYGMCATVYKNTMWLVGGIDTGLTNYATVWSTTDATTFSVVAASYGGNGFSFGGIAVFRTPASISAISAPTMWIMGGIDSVIGYRKLVYYATLNVPIPSSFSIGTAGATTDQFKFTTQSMGTYLVFKNTSDAWVLYAGTLQKITDTNYPQTTAPGIVNLDDTLYVMDLQGQIFGSNLSTPFNWSSLNFITADYDSDAPVALAKYQNFVVAFKSFTTQFFYDAGRYPGSPLLPVTNANMRVGCVNAGTIASMNNTLIFMARGITASSYIAMLDGYTPTRISTPDVERILNSWLPDSSIYAWTMRINGHDFYFLTLKTSNITLAYDLTEKRWHTWASGSAYFSGVNYVTDGTTDYVQDLLLGKLYSFSPLIYLDSGATITVSVQGDKVDGGTNNKKFCSSLTVIGDRRGSAPNNATITYSDDDAQTFTTWGTVDLTLPRPRLTRGGSFYRRQHKITHASNNPFRVKAFELEVMGG